MKLNEEDSEENLLIKFDNLEAHYPVIAPHAPNQSLFSVSTRPRLHPNYDHARLIGLNADTQIRRYPTQSPKFDSSCYADHIRVRLDYQNTSQLGFDQRADTVRGSSPGHSETRPSTHSTYSSTRTPLSPTFSRLFEHAESSEHAIRSCMRAAWRSSRPSVLAPSDVLRTAFHDVSPPASPPADDTTNHFPPPAANPIAPVRTPDGKIALAFPKNGTLHSLSVATLHPRLQLTSRTSNTPNSLLFNNDGVTHVRTADAVGGDPVRLLACTDDTALLAIQTDEEMRLCDAHDMRILDARFNPLADELAILRADGLQTAPIDLVARATVRDVHALDPRAQFCSIDYTAHARVLLLAGRLSISTLDLREDWDPVPLVRPSAWRLPVYDGVFSTVRMATGASFQVVATTLSQVSYFDIRVPHVPLVSLPYELATPITRVGLTRVSDCGGGPEAFSEILALVAPAHGYFAVAQVAHIDEGITKVSFLGDSGRKMGVPNSRVVWGDDPFHIGSLLPTIRQGDCPGVAILPQQNEGSVNSTEGRELDVVHWTRSEGLTICPFSVRRTFGWDNYGGLDQENGNVSSLNNMDSGGGNGNGSLIDSSVGILNTQHALVAAGVDVSIGDVLSHPVSKSLGVVLQSRTRRLPVDLSLMLRDSICEDGEDEICDGTRMARAAMGKLGVHADKSDVRATEPDVSVALQEGAMTVDEVGRFLREGNGEAHGQTPLANALNRVLEISPLVVGESVSWHEDCVSRDKHDRFPTCVSTGDELPDWVNRTVFFPASGELGEGLGGWTSCDEADGAEGAAPVGSEFGKMVSNMRDMFFDGTETAVGVTVKTETKEEDQVTVRDASAVDTGDEIADLFLDH